MNGPACRVIAQIEQDRRAAIHKSELHQPSVDCDVLSEVTLDLVAPAIVQPRDQIELDLVRQHVAQPVEVARIEAIDVDGQASALGFRQSR